MIRRAENVVVGAVLALAIALLPASARAEDQHDTTVRVLAVTGAALGGLSLFFGLEAQLANAHAAPPSDSRDGVATVFTIVSISSLVLSVASLGVSLFLATRDESPTNAPVATSAAAVRILCPNLSCLPKGSR